MNLVVLRMEGDQENLSTLTQALSLNVEQEWRKGEPGRNGSRHLSSGLSATIADVSTGAELIRAVRSFVAKCKDLGLFFSGVRAELSIGVTVGDSEQFVAHIAFSNSDLVMLADRGLTVSVAAYPTSDEANKAPRAI